MGVALCVLSTAAGARLAWEPPEAGSEAGTETVAETVSVSAAETVSETVPDPLRDVGGARFAGGATITGATPHRLILFTFDDGPDKHTTPRILDQLDAEDVKALFFVTTSRFGREAPWQRENAELVREIARRGHLIGSHTHRHVQLPLMRTEEIKAELERSAKRIEDTIGRRPWLVRPPGGAMSPRVDRVLASQGYTTVLWNLGAGDLVVESPRDVVRTWKRVLERREREFGDRGGIILLHDTHEQSVQAFPRIVEALRQRNCDLLERGEELYDIVDDLDLFSPDTSLGSIATRQAVLREESATRCGTLALR